MSPLDHTIATVAASTGYQRNARLVAFARSSLFMAAGMMLDGHEGEVHREAHAALKRELEADTPANAWDKAWDAKGRTAIYRALRIDPADPTAYFATHPFRVIQIDDQNWIAGAVGCPSLLRADDDVFGHLDIEDVILWNPRTSAVRVMGDAPKASRLILPCDPLTPRLRLTVYADGFAFFRAWADARAILAAKAENITKWHRPPAELPDNELPGALVVGDLDQIHWRDTGAPVLVAGPGVDDAALKRAIYRSANLPRVETTPYLEAVA